MDAIKQYPSQDELVKGRQVCIGDMSPGDFLKVDGNVGMVSTLKRNSYSKKKFHVTINKVGPEEGVLFEGVMPITKVYQTPDRILTVRYDGEDWRPDIIQYEFPEHLRSNGRPVYYRKKN